MIHELPVSDYLQPVLTRLGTVAELTLLNPSGSRMDNGDMACTPGSMSTSGTGDFC